MIAAPIRDRVAIEQAIARGWTTSRIMVELGYDYTTVQAVRTAMWDAVTLHYTDVRGERPKPVPKAKKLGTLPDRPLSTCYGPAAPEVIEALIDALFPPRRRRAA